MTTHKHNAGLADRVLSVLQDMNEGMTAKQLAEHLMVSSHSASRAVTTLKERGLAYGIPNRSSGISTWYRWDHPKALRHRANLPDNAPPPEIVPPPSINRMKRDPYTPPRIPMPMRPGALDAFKIPSRLFSKDET